MSYKTGFYEGRLGIGLGSTMGMGDGNPRYPLDINGDIRLTGSIVNGDGQVLSLVPAESLWTIGNNNLSYAGGNVGIGNSSPEYLLDLADSTYAVGIPPYPPAEFIRFTCANTTGNSSGGLIWKTNYGGSYTKISAKIQAICEGDYFRQGLAFFTGNETHTTDATERMRIDMDGKVGIGTTSPDELLHVENTGGGARIKIQGSSDSSVLTLTSNSNSNYIFTNTSGDLYLRTDGSDLLLSDTGGNVGIGTTSPGYLLDLRKDVASSSGNKNEIGINVVNEGSYSGSYLKLGRLTTGLHLNYSREHSSSIIPSLGSHHGEIYTDGNYGLYIGTNNTPRISILGGGNVGIGTTSPLCKLDLGDLGGSSIRLGRDHDGSNTSDNSIGRSGTNGSWTSRICFFDDSTNDDGIYFTTHLSGVGEEERMRILGNGNVGIGTTSPSQKLHVSGNFYLSGYQSIGTTSILYPLWVASRSANPAQGGSKGAGRYFTDGGDLRSLSNWGVEYSNGYGGGGVATADAGKTSIRADGIIWSDIAVAVSSDSRIKKNIVDVPDHQALEMVRNIPCRYYEYIDNTFIKREGKTIGFIAQEVKDILPMAVNQETRFIPDVMKMLSVDNENIIDWTEHVDNSNNKIFKMKYDELGNVNNIEYKFYVADVSNNSSLEKIIIGNEDNTFTFEQKWNYVFCYGRKVDDFHILDKQKLFALNFSATQELDRKVIALENENAELKAELAAIKQHLGI